MGYRGVVIGGGSGSLVCACACVCLHVQRVQRAACAACASSGPIRSCGHRPGVRTVREAGSGVSGVLTFRGSQRPETRPFRGQTPFLVLGKAVSAPSEGVFGVKIGLQRTLQCDLPPPNRRRRTLRGQGGVFRGWDVCLLIPPLRSARRAVLVAVWFSGFRRKRCLPAGTGVLGG